MVLGEAVGGDATAFVTGDTKLLDLGHLGDVQIISPRAFWDMLQAGQPSTSGHRLGPAPLDGM